MKLLLHDSLTRQWHAVGADVAGDEVFVVVVVTIVVVVAVLHVRVVSAAGVGDGGVTIVVVAGGDYVLTLGGHGG